MFWENNDEKYRQNWK